jgi:tricarballylate dehydrogenase
MTPPGPTLLQRPWDVVVIGGGNAALVSALSARETGASVLVLERAPKVVRGGNSRHTRNVRCVHDSADDFYTGAYSYDEMWDDLGAVGEGPNDEGLASLTLHESATVPRWMTESGIRWQHPLSGTLQLGRTNRFFLGGGKALLNSYYRRAAAVGVEVAYEASVEELGVDGPNCRWLLVRTPTGDVRVEAKAVVCASGGFEANVEWLARYWGDAAYNYVIRGPVYNDGTVLARLLAAGSEQVGQEKGFHAIAVDARSPRFDGGIATRLDCIPFGICVNERAERFYDEGEDIWPKRYASWGSTIARQPNQIAYALWDSQVHRRFLPPMYGSLRADTVPELAGLLGVEPAALDRTVRDYNAATRADARDRVETAGKLDGVGTSGLSPEKSNWALPLDRPPFYGVPMRPGITFTYMGVGVDKQARVRRTGQNSFANVFAAGEIMSGNILSTGYLAGFGMTIGTVWGRIAGQEAGRHALG